MFEKYNDLADAYKALDAVYDSYKLPAITKELAMTVLFVATFFAVGLALGWWGIPSLAVFAGSVATSYILAQIYYKAPSYIKAQRTIRDLE